ncbi:hypothetical protein [Halegenticoccus tardaugens]|uniref:hypothetical protein n=1 Tax=Halegenticoccus tardaugens TaxID=2071624 RepID=UPI00100A381E|nr:hypothetical protein [Halegenticoccus tardaugens]
MVEERTRCSRCRRELADGEPHVWLRIESADLGYEPLDRLELLCKPCYRSYQEFLSPQTA